MPRPKRAYGRPGTRVFPADWSPSHAVVMDKTLTATCRIRPPATDPATMNDDLSYPDADALPIQYEGGCRVQALSDTATTKRLGDEYVGRSSFLVVITLDADAEIGRGCTVEMLTSTDERLNGRVLVVVQADLGSLRWERDLYCVEEL